ELNRNSARFLKNGSQVAPAMARQDDAVDPGRNLETASHPRRRHQRGDRDRQDGDLGNKASTRSQFVEHLPQGELSQAAGDEEEAGKSVRGRCDGAQRGRCSLSASEQLVRARASQTEGGQTSELAPCRVPSRRS